MGGYDDVNTLTSPVGRRCVNYPTLLQGSSKHNQPNRFPRNTTVLQTACDARLLKKCKQLTPAYHRLQPAYPCCVDTNVVEAVEQHTWLASMCKTHAACGSH